MSNSEQPVGLTAVVTGASSGIGAATARRLRAEGWAVVAVARRGDRLQALADECGVEPFVADITSDDDVARLVEHLAGRTVNALVNNAGGAIGTDPVAQADLDAWARMYELNVLGTTRVTRGLLPALLASGRGDVVVVTSTAAHEPHAGGGGYGAAKHAEWVVSRTLRLELVGQPVRVIEIAPGMVQTEEFALNRFDGDAAKAAAVYAGVAEPLLAQDIADAIVWALTRPHHVTIDSMIIRPRAQASYSAIARDL